MRVLVLLSVLAVLAEGFNVLADPEKKKKKRARRKASREETKGLNRVYAHSYFDTWGHWSTKPDAVYDGRPHFVRPKDPAGGYKLDEPGNLQPYGFMLNEPEEAAQEAKAEEKAAEEAKATEAAKKAEDEAKKDEQANIEAQEALRVDQASKKAETMAHFRPIMIPLGFWPSPVPQPIVDLWDAQLINQQTGKILDSARFNMGQALKMDAAIKKPPPNPGVIEAGRAANAAIDDESLRIRRHLAQGGQLPMGQSMKPPRVYVPPPPPVPGWFMR